MAPQAFEIAQNGLEKGRSVRRDRLESPALRASSETVITPPHHPVSKSRMITASPLRWLATGFAK
jgi:hypothetical protein